MPLGLPHLVSRRAPDIKAGLVHVDYLESILLSLIQIHSVLLPGIVQLLKSKADWLQGIFVIGFSISDLISLVELVKSNIRMVGCE